MTGLDAVNGALPAVELDGLVHRFGDAAAVDGLDLTVRTGEVFGLLGPNGAGKTTTLRVIVTLLPVQHGVFHADRNARRLDRVPDGVSGIEPPLWLVDRGASDRVVLYGRATDGQGRLITLKQEKIDGIATTGVDDLGTAVGDRKI